jgi:hypothetical protein
LALLSFAKLELYDHIVEYSKDNDEEILKELLEDSKALLTVAAENVTNRINDTVPNTITDQKWWKKVEANEKAMQQQAQALLAGKTDKPKTPVSGARRTSTVPNQAAAKKAPPAPAAPAAKTNGKASAGKPGDAKSPAANGQSPTADLSTAKYVKKESSFDRKVLQTQCSLCLARVYARLKEFDKAKSFYEQVIKSEPRVIEI